MSTQQRRASAIAGALLFALAACSSSEDAGPTSSTTGPNPRPEPSGTIVVEGGAGDDERLYLISADGSGAPRRLTDQPAFGPTIAEDGQTVAYTADAGPASAVHVHDLISDSTRSLAPGACPTFTPAGDVAVGGDRTGRGLWPVDGAARTATLPGEAIGCVRAVSDGRYVRWDQTDEVVLVDEDGGERSGINLKGCGLGPVDVDGSGETLAFTAACDDERSGLYTWPIDGDAHPHQVLAGAAYGAARSPDDQWLATAAHDGAEDHFTLVLVRPDGSDRRVIDTPGTVNNPAWGPSIDVS